MGHKSERLERYRHGSRCAQQGKGDGGRLGRANQEVWATLEACWIMLRASGGRVYLLDIGWLNWANSEAHFIPTWPASL